MFDWLKFAWLWFHPAGAHMRSATRFSLVTFSYGHWIRPQGEVQPERSSYDNIIVRNVKGQTAARLVLRGLCWENHRWLWHCCKANTLHRAGGREKCQRGPPVPPFSPLPSAFCPFAPAASLVGKVLAAGYVRASRLLALRNAWGSRTCSVHAASGTQGTYQSNWGGLTDDHLLTMWPCC